MSSLGYSGFSEKQIREMRNELKGFQPKSLKKAEFRLLKIEIRKLCRGSKNDKEQLIASLDRRDALFELSMMTRLLDRINLKGESTMLLAACFLLAFEGGYTGLLDEVCFLLVAKGHDLFDPLGRQYASSLREINEIDLSTKLKFLERHGFNMLVRNEDKRLRNRIAHHDFRLDKKGEILIDGQRVDLISRSTDLTAFLYDVNVVSLETILNQLMPVGRKKRNRS
jgi:hypothetical protein